MFKPRESFQSEYEFVSIDEFVPDDHLLRLIDKYIDFSFLLEKVRTYSMYTFKKYGKSCNTTCMGGAQGKGKVKSLI
ncbi:hypothetical protein BACCIP111895_00675 [Neobacillus rhizosphaerae]|uniref:Transposase n=1 Tax=Neobacillus rhizosphaerae TaxID=2880965 RepID=A0ABN8KN31_9BACI|nr:hypothetical protein [Neobacillus rhizosphaerae]CAH2713539.1 hypothetical protein BACCIP111895_00675 [Neobacillus rhizosphaerae]